MVTKTQLSIPEHDAYYSALMEPCRYKVWGEVGSDFDEPSLKQLLNACHLPVSVAAALMPDAHVGYGLPIGGVLATRDAVIPYAVGVDIACRLKLSVVDIDSATFDKPHVRDRLAKAIEQETRFGVGAHFRGHDRREHAVMDMDWNASHVTIGNKDKAWAQLGTSGSGNHFVEWGILEVFENAPRGIDQRSLGGSHARLDLPPGRYVALLSHSGSRGTGAAVCDHYSKLAASLHPDLDGEARRLAWLDMNSQAGQEYWGAMNLMGEYASANHDCIHRSVAKHLGARVIADVENHHNFAWKETHEIDGRAEEVIVHRKGATPAGEGVIGIIPGSMATPGYIVTGRGGAGSLNSSSHGAGRVMSRTAAKKALVWGNVKKRLQSAGVTLLSAGIDEAPDVYKDIERVLDLQTDLVTRIARFTPSIVKMAPEGERAED